MLRSKAQELLFGGPLYEALSGEFWAPTDPAGRIHTLGHIARSAFDEGDVVVGGYDPNHMGFSYRPEWAPNIEATLICERYSVEFDDMRPARLIGRIFRAESLVLLEINGDQDFSVHNRLKDNSGACDNRLQVVRNFVKIADVPTHDEVQLACVKSFIAQNAQEFFDLVS